MSDRTEIPTVFPLAPSRRRLWPFRVLGTLGLGIQAAGIYVAVFHYADRIGSVLEWIGWKPKHLHTAGELVSGVSYLLLFKPLAVLLVIGALGIAFARWSGWMIAMLGQCFLLYICLSLYFTGPAIPAIYPIMMSAVVMVLFLNSNGVRLLFPAAARAAT
jgi:hypothetical protein